MHKYLALVLVALFFPFSGQSKDKTQASFPSKALHFIENKGQIVDQHNKYRQDIDYVVSSGNMSLFIGNGELHYQWHKFNKTGAPTKNNVIAEGDVETYRMDVELIGTNKDAFVLAEGKTGFYENYYLSQCPNGISAFAYSKLTYKNIYPEIDWVIYSKDGKLEHEFVVRQGGDPAQIRLKYNGATELNVTSDGSLNAKTPMGGVVESAPYSFQEDGKVVLSSFALNGNVLSFNVAQYEGVLTIDPVLDWATYFGGSDGESAYDMAADINGNVYIVGLTQSANAIATAGAHQQTLGTGLYCGFIAKFDSAGVQQWGTYYGNGHTHALAVVVGDGNQCYVAGNTNSPDAIASIGGHQETMNGFGDLFLVKFNEAGIRQWGTYFGGESAEEIPSLTYDGNGYVYLTGNTYSFNDIATSGTYLDALPISSGGYASFISKFDINGVQIWGSYFDSASVIYGVSASGNAVYISGETTNESLATVGAHQIINNGMGDAFLSSFNTVGQRIWTTYYGGDSVDFFEEVVIGESNNIYASGVTKSANNIATTGSHQEIIGGKRDVVLVKFNPSGQRMWGTYYGGSENDEVSQGSPLCFDDSGNVFMSGATLSANDIATTGSYQGNIAGAWDNFLVELDSIGERKWASYYGGGNDEAGGSCAFAGNGIIYLAGGTVSTLGIATPGSHSDIFGGYHDCYIAKFLKPALIPPPPPQSVGNTGTLVNLSIYPNPVQDELHINGLEMSTPYTLTTIEGKIVQEGALQEGTASLNLIGLSSGIYILTADDWKLKVVKN